MHLKLNSIWLSEAVVGLEGAKIISEMIKESTTLKTINLSSNPFGQEGFTIITLSLKNN